MSKFNRILLTGAAGALGKVLRVGLAPLATHLRLSDIEALGDADDNEELVQTDLADFDAVMDLCKDVDMVAHFGGKAVEGTSKEVFSSNITGGYNIYEACRRNSVKRVVFASSNHSIGYYKRTERIDDHVPHRPDTLYGVSKAFTEDLASFYWDKFGLETVSLRIGSCFPEPKDRRMLATWMSHRDLVQLVSRSLTAPYVGFHAVYGVSDNSEQFWDTSSARLIGYKPEDNAEVFREKVEAASSPQDLDDPALIYAGGMYTAFPHYDDEQS